MAVQRFLALAVLLLAVAAVEGRSKYQGRLLKTSYKAPPGIAHTYTVTGGPPDPTTTLFTDLTTSNGGSITLMFNTITLTRGLTTNYDFTLSCASGFTCIIDCSAVTYTACLIIHGGANVTLSGVTFDGKGVPRTAPLIEVQGSTTLVTLSSVALDNANVVGPGNAAGAAIEVLPPTAGSGTKYGSTLILKPGTTFSNNTVLGKPIDIGVYGTATQSATVTSCFASSSAGSIPGIDFSGKTGVSVCSTSTPSNPPTPVNTSTTQPPPVKTTVTSGTCPYSGC